MTLSTALDITRSFNQDVSLHTLIHQEAVKKVLLATIDHFYAERTSGVNPNYPMILLVGKTATTIAHAISNSICNVVLHCVEGAYLSHGIGLDDFLLQGDLLSTYYIHCLERMNDWYLHDMSRILNERIIREAEKVGMTEEHFHPFGGLLICSAHDIDRLDDHLLDSFDVICRLAEYNQESVLRILEQRLKYMGWRAEPSVLSNIADLTKGDVKLAINILRWTYRCSKVDGDEILKIKNLNTALRLLS